jgi:hypothetical protein
MTNDSDLVEKIYEETFLKAKALVPAASAEQVEDVTFKFFHDGEPFAEKTISLAEGEGDSGGDGEEPAVQTEGDSVVVTHRVQAPALTEGKGGSLLEYHFFYTVKQPDGTTVKRQQLGARRLEVLPRTARLKVTRAKDDQAFPGFRFKVEQAGAQVGDVQCALAYDTQNAKDETIPAGSAEFNLALERGFRIVQVPPYEIVEEVVSSGTQRELKGALRFRAVFLAPEKGNRKQYVNDAVQNRGQSGVGHEVVVEVGVHPRRGRRGPVPRHLRPRRRRARRQERPPGRRPPDQGLAGRGRRHLGDHRGEGGGEGLRGQDQAHRRHGPDQGRPGQGGGRHLQGRDLRLAEVPRARRQLERVGRQTFIEFEECAFHTFDAMEHADHGTLAPRRFLGEADSDEVVYVLSGRNWRDLPAGTHWSEEHPGKTLHVAVCDSMLKYRTDTSDEKKGTSDFSGTLTEASGWIDVAEKLGGLLMPFSGYDADDGVSGLEWTADISKDDAVCKHGDRVYHPGLDDDLNPRSGTFDMHEVTDAPACTVTEWHFVLPGMTPTGEPGPGTFVGPEKTESTCPVKVAFSTQAHEFSPGIAEGKAIGWVADAAAGPEQLVRLFCQGTAASPDAASLDHGHGEDGAGQCLAEESALCAGCLDHLRSRDLTAIG